MRIGILKTRRCIEFIACTSSVIKSSGVIEDFVKYNKPICTNLMVQASHIPGHEIRIVSYALWDSGDCRLYKAG